MVPATRPGTRTANAAAAARTPAATRTHRRVLRKETADGFMNGIGRPPRPGAIVVRPGFPKGGRARPDRAEALDGRRPEEDERRRARGGGEMRGSRISADEERGA